MRQKSIAIPSCPRPRRRERSPRPPVASNNLPIIDLSPTAVPAPHSLPYSALWNSILSRMRYLQSFLSLRIVDKWGFTIVIESLRL